MTKIVVEWKKFPLNMSRIATFEAAGECQRLLNPPKLFRSPVKNKTSKNLICKGLVSSLKGVDSRLRAHVVQVVAKAVSRSHDAAD